MTTKPRFKIGDSVVVGSRKSDWYGKIGRVVAMYESGRYGVTCYGDPPRAFKMTSLSHADKWYKAQWEAQREADRTQSKIDPKWHEKVTHEMARFHDNGWFASPSIRTANDCACPK
jgi:hypothetical protein